MPDPLHPFREFRRNTGWYAAYRVTFGEPHRSEHHVIRQRLDAWWRQIVAVTEELLEAAREILDATEAERGKVEPPRRWMMPSTTPAREPGAAESVSEVVVDLPELTRTKMAVCEDCGAEFQAERATRKYCSQACQKRAWRAAA